MEHDESDEETLSDAAWEAIRAAVPSFATRWLAITQDSSCEWQRVVVEAGKDFWIESRILDVSRRSSDLPDELRD